MKKVTIYFILIFVLVLGCTDNYKEIVKEYYTGTNVPKEKIIYPNKKDTSNYIAIFFYESGDTSGKCEYKKNRLVRRDYWVESKAKIIEDDIILITEKTVIVNDSSGNYKVTADVYIGTFKHWNKEGVLIYETHVLPNRKEQRITIDSIGNVLKIDTISY